MLLPLTCKLDTFFFWQKVACSLMQVVNAHSHDKKVWLSGLAPAWAGGTSNLSDTYAAGFLWVRQRIFMRSANSCEFYWQMVTFRCIKCYSILRSIIQRKGPDSCFTPCCFQVGEHAGHGCHARHWRGAASLLLRLWILTPGGPAL